MGSTHVVPHRIGHHCGWLCNDSTVPCKTGMGVQAADTYDTGQPVPSAAHSYGRQEPIPDYRGILGLRWTWLLLKSRKKKLVRVLVLLL
jgi:hypothetical protein